MTLMQHGMAVTTHFPCILKFQKDWDNPICEWQIRPQYVLFNTNEVRAEYIDFGEISLI